MDITTQGLGRICFWGGGWGGYRPRGVLSGSRITGTDGRGIVIDVGGHE
jgi:hypothetical protein